MEPQIDFDIKKETPDETTSSILNDLENILDSVGQKRKKNRTVICEVCNFKCSNKHYLSVHNDRVHLNIERFACGKCDYKSYFSKPVINHQQNVTDVQVIRIGCKLCSEGVTHEPCSNIKPMLKKCRLCTFKFLLGSEITIHYTKEHEGKHVVNYDKYKIQMHKETINCKHCQFITSQAKEMVKKKTCLTVTNVTLEAIGLVMLKTTMNQCTPLRCTIVICVIINLSGRVERQNTKDQDTKYSNISPNTSTQAKSAKIVILLLIHHRKWQVTETNANSSSPKNPISVTNVARFSLVK